MSENTNAEEAIVVMMVVIRHLLLRLNSNLNDDDAIAYVESYINGENLDDLTNKYLELKEPNWDDLKDFPMDELPKKSDSLKDSSGDFGSEF